MKEYYRQRASQYDRFYEVPERLHDVIQLKAWLMDRVRGRTVLEVAAGTGHWTEAAAASAKAITAIDYNPETLSIAADRQLGPHVTLLAGDAYALPEFTDRFEVGMAHLWWSHVERQRRQEFLSHFASRLQPSAALLMIDQVYVEGLCSPILRRDAWGNQYTVRTLENGTSYEIVKNFFTLREIKESVGDMCEDIKIVQLDHFWALAARVRGE
jgi:SAM-dependent methyltransferase